MMSNQDFNDDIGFGETDGLDEILSAPARTAPVAAPEEKPYFDRCYKCSGTGMTRWGTCFACQGKGGKSFKTPHAVRGAAKMQAEERKDRTRASNVETFKINHPAEWAWIQSRVTWELTKAQGGQDFGQSLRAAVVKHGDLSEKQIAAIRTNMVRMAERAEARAAAPAPTIDISRIEQAFAKAAESGLGKLRLRLATTKFETKLVDGKQEQIEVLDHDYLFYPAKPTGRNPGGIYVKEDGEYLGKVTEGRFRCVATCGDVRRDQIVQVASDPAQAASAHGRVLGECSICGRELSAAESVARSMGPICASRYGF
jgi:hypothetical protein